jgi:carbon storage regulator CsrA
MLKLSRKIGEQFRIGDDVTVTILKTTRGQALVGIEAPSSVPVIRQEAWDEARRLSHATHALGYAGPSALEDNYSGGASKTSTAGRPIPSNNPTPVDQLLESVERLPPDDFRRFLDSVLALNARRLAPQVSAAEADLLRRINQGLPDQVRARHDELVARRRAEALTDEEYKELLDLTDQVERAEADRLAALSDLAAVRHTPLPSLLHDLGIPAPAHG